MQSVVETTDTELIQEAMTRFDPLANEGFALLAPKLRDEDRAAMESGMRRQAEINVKAGLIGIAAAKKAWELGRVERGDIPRIAKEVAAADYGVNYRSFLTDPLHPERMVLHERIVGYLSDWYEEQTLEFFYSDLAAIPELNIEAHRVKNHFEDALGDIERAIAAPPAEWLLSEWLWYSLNHGTLAPA